MRRRVVVAILCLILPAALPPAKASAQEAAARQELVQGITRFAIDLYGRLKEDSGNVVFSPLGISSVGVLAWRGARGETARQIAAALRLERLDDQLLAAAAALQAGLTGMAQTGGIELAIACSLWPQQKYPFLAEYLESVRSFPVTEVIPVDYATGADQARRAINAWVEKATRSRITDILGKPLNRLTRLFIVNAVYFKGPWTYRFPASATEEAPFYPEGTQPVDVRLMQQQGRFPYYSDDLAQVLELPYSGDGFAMVVLLPRQRDGLPALEKALTEERVGAWLRALSTSDVRVLFPRFTFTYSVDLVGPLKSLGIRDAFEQGKADFSGMDGVPRWLYVDTVVHKAFVKVDEAGTEAAAATAAGGCFPAGTEVLTADGPVPIEKVSPGSRVLSGDPTTGAWSLATVRGRQKVAYDGDLIAIRAGDASVGATGNHPFFVLRGEGLPTRPRPRDLPPDDPVSTERGRWVEARSLRVGDVLMDRGAGATVTGLSVSRAAIDVYNLDVEGPRTYAVHRGGILVHNKGSAESPVEIFRADHPFLFLILDRTDGAILFMGRVSRPVA